MKLFGNKSKGKRYAERRVERREDRRAERYDEEILDFDEYDEDDYPEDEIDDRYADDEYADEDDCYEDDDYADEDDRYEDEDYADEDDRYADDGDDYADDRHYDEVDSRFEDEPEDYADEDDHYADDEYADEDARYDDEDRYEYGRYYEDDRYADDKEDVYYPGDNRRASRGGRGNKFSRDDRSRRDDRRGRRDSRRDRDDRESVFGKIGAFIAATTAVERIAAIFAILLVAGGILTVSFYVSARNNRNQLAAFSEVGSTMTEGTVVGESGLIAVADAERARAMAAQLVSEDSAVLGESREEEEVPDDAENVTIKMTVTSIKSDIKVKFINSETNKLVANLPLEIEVVGPDGTKVTYNDHDHDGIIYKKDITKGEYKITPKALPAGYESYKLELKSKTVTVKDTVEMKAVDVSNEVKKESQVNAAKEDTAVKTEVESQLADTVEWVESTKTPVGESSDGSFTYEEVKKEDIPNPTQSSMVGTRDWMLLGFARGKSNEGSSSDASSEVSTVVEEPKQLTVSPSSITIKIGESETISVKDGDSEIDATLSADSKSVSISGKTIKGELAGTAVITVKASGYEDATVSVTVEENPNSDFSVNGSTVNIKVGESKSIGASASSTITYESKDTSIATVSGDGTVTGVKEGSTTVTLKAEGYNDGTVTVVVAKADNKNMSGVPTIISMKVGESTQIKITEPSSVKFESDKESVATVDQKGNVKAVAEGTANIRITAEGYNPETVAVTVSKADAKIMKVEPTSLTVKVSETAQIKVTEPSKVTFATDNDKVATVDKKGKVTGVSVGKTAIRISADGYEVFTVNVDVVAKEGNKVPMSISKITLCEGQSIKVSSTDKNASIKLATSSEKVAAVKDTTITGKAAGEATITVSATGYTENTITVKVVSKGTTLKDKNGNVLYVLKTDGTYREATYEDYYSGAKLYKRKAATTYRYTGWQTIGGKTYFFDKNGNYVTGEQVIQGAKYTFGSDGALQNGSGTMGIDVSKWNGSIDWAAVKNSGVNFVIIRCGYRGSSEGALIEDPKFRANINGAQNAGIKVGVYFFTQAVNEVEAVEEASMVINLIKGYNISYPVYLDVEASHGRGDTISAAQRTANIKAFCGTIQNAGYKAGVYANKTWFTSYINTSQITNYRIWLAQYASAVTYSGSRYDMWQYSSKGRVTGISGYVDMNICY